ncbi:unnamed protein product [Schistosoma curassoni]|uniref:FLYWCH-type domain-containing protein n=1 Tax=Schistosoma curassoni TaxID=6186 RepID=A0A183L497_9TREM|nr:unnamed protein product [Schistosoma curassoni]
MNPPDIEAAHTGLPIDVNPPTTEEIRMAIRQIKRGKAARPDNVPAEALKSDIEVTTFYSRRFGRRNKCLWTRKKDTSSRFQRKKIWANVKTTEALYSCQYQGKSLTEGC